jgi:hypothetical protein
MRSRGTSCKAIECNEECLEICMEKGDREELNRTYNSIDEHWHHPDAEHPDNLP